MRIAAISDLHCRVGNKQLMEKLLKEVERHADVLVLAGDLTDTGLPAEMDVLTDVLAQIPIEKIAVLGNHDHENDQQELLVQMLEDCGVCVLNGSACEIDNVGFVGSKGFAGGFGSTMVQPFGERALKQFIQTTLDEAVKLENAAAKITCAHKVAILHYAPIPETLQGEPIELFPFLGCSRLANAIDRQGVEVVFHGHAHHGSPFGRTAGNVPVYNVSRFVQNAANEQDYCIYTIGENDNG